MRYFILTGETIDGKLTAEAGQNAAAFREKVQAAQVFDGKHGGAEYIRLAVIDSDGNLVMQRQFYAASAKKAAAAEKAAAEKAAADADDKPEGKSNLKKGKKS